MPKVCFFKEIATNTFYVNGAPVQFDPLPGNRGCIALESPKDDALITALTDAATKHVGGISMISEAALAEKKSQASLMPLTPPRKKEMLRSMPKGPLARKQATAGPANSQPVSRDAVPLTNSAANLREAARLAQSPAPAALSTAPAEVPAQVAAEGFRPPTRRISRNPISSRDSVPAQ